MISVTSFSTAAGLIWNTQRGMKTQTMGTVIHRIKFCNTVKRYVYSMYMLSLWLRNFHKYFHILSCNFIVRYKLILSRYFWHKVHNNKNPIKTFQRGHWFGYQLRNVVCCFYFLYFTSLLVIYLLTIWFCPYLRTKNIDSFL